MTKMRKLRTLKEILEMFPDAHFDNYGDLRYGDGNWVPPKMFHQFGCDTSDIWDERLYAEPKTRKTYAYTNKGDGKIYWFKQELGVVASFLNYERAPEFDYEVES